MSFNTDGKNPPDASSFPMYEDPVDLQGGKRGPLQALAGDGGADWNYLRVHHASGLRSRPASRMAVTLASRIVRDRALLSAAGIDRIGEHALLMAHGPCDFATASRLLSTTPAAPASDPPAPTLSPRAEVARRLSAAGQDRETILCRMGALSGDARVEVLRALADAPLDRAAATEGGLEPGEPLTRGRPFSFYLDGERTAERRRVPAHTQHPVAPR
jgi:hypothetical protein